MFYEEELDVPLVLFNEVLDHVLRIDRIFRQPQVTLNALLVLYDLKMKANLYQSFSCYVVAAMLVHVDKRFPNSFYW